MKKNNTEATVKISPLTYIKNRIFYPTCMIYTLINIFFYLCGTAFDLEDRHMVLTRGSAFLIILFSFILALSNLILTAKKPRLHISLRVFLHYVITTLSFYILFLSISGYEAGTSSTIIILLVFTIVYFAIIGTVFAVKGTAKKSRIDSSEYKSIYGE